MGYLLAINLNQFGAINTSETKKINNIKNLRSGLGIAYADRYF